MLKIVRPGKIEVRENYRKSFFCTIRLNDGKLSISGVIGPLPSGNCSGGCGQIDMEFAHRNPDDNDKRYSNLIKPSDITFAPGWDKEKWFDFLEVWSKWHLNDMRAGCEHQRKAGWGNKTVTIVKVNTHEWRLYNHKDKKEITAGLAYINKLKRPFKNINLYPYWVRKHYVCRLYNEVLLHAKQGKVYQPKNQAAASWLGKERIIEITTETTLTTWINPSEHPEGVLGKPCPECGYQYGTKHLMEVIPVDVLTFLYSLPDADSLPPSRWIDKE